ncbi:hypothetical protein [Bacillus piscicola]|uniref:hypothetical protein n=1 Tax=Bacillus piscicola TaxID=1632684 RepID=UPI001F08B54D|nr:hypothetical protein [Bacillus piscicola]
MDNYLQLLAARHGSQQALIALLILGARAHHDPTLLKNFDINKIRHIIRDKRARDMMDAIPNAKE